MTDGIDKTVHSPGDVVNGHVLGSDNQWHPVAVTDTLEPVAPKKRKRVFMWVFLAVQALFLAWIISGLGSSSGTPDADCGTLSTETCNDLESIGTGIGVFMVIVFWMMVDFLLAVGYAIYRLAKRP